MKSALSPAITLPLLALVTLLAFSGGACSQGRGPVDSLDIRIGQMLMVGFQGMSAPEDSPIARDIRDCHIGGVVLFDYDVPSGRAQRNIESAEQVRRLTTELQRHADIPLFIAIDQEGGRVNRLKVRYGFLPTVSQQHLGTLDNPDSTSFQASRTATQLHAIGCNLNFAPVADVNTNSGNPVIGRLERSFSPDPATVLKHVLITIDRHHDQHVLTAIKHFPGHGSSTGDSHEGFVDVTKTWNPKELLPFAGTIAAGKCDLVMTAHIFNARLDPLNPATLSHATITGLLRDSLKWDGVVVSDDMQMKAIASQYDFETALRLVVEAGVDCIVFANNTATFDASVTKRAFTTLKQLVTTGTISRERIDASYRRIMALKRRL